MRDLILCGADLKEANLKGADLRGANLGPDNLGGSTQLQGAGLLGAQLSGATMTLAEYDDATVFPVGFDPQLYGYANSACESCLDGFELGSGSSLSPSTS
jgi:hypothetical protein